MNEKKLPPTTLLFAGETLSVSLIDKSQLTVRVRALPARHLNSYLDLRDIGREADLLAAVMQMPDAEAKEGEFPGWRAADAAFVDNLSDEAHVALIALADQLNFPRAVSQAERQIATGTALLELKKRVATTMIGPLEQALHSLISSATMQLSKAVAENKP